MADESSQAEAQQGASSKKLLPLIAAGVVSLAVGLGAGALVVGPRIAPAPAAAASSASAHGEQAPAEEEGSSDEHAATGESGAGSMHVVDNIVLNPAGSNGTRFLMVSAAFELKSAEAADQMGALDAQARDAILRVLGAKSVDQLSDLSRRDSIKAEVRDAVAPLLPKGAIHRIYFPSFVIQ
jgi:flagellar FliL protein